MPHSSNSASSPSGPVTAGADTVLRTKLFVPPVRTRQVERPRLNEKLDDGLDKALVLVSAPAGFGKTMAVAQWVARGQHRVAWLSLDEADNDLIRFLTYLIAALQTIEPSIGRRVLSALQSPQPPGIEWSLRELLNEITTIAGDFVLVLDDYHLIDAKAVDDALTFLLEHQPAQMHLVIATREDPHLPLAQLRSRGRLVEVRINELRFDPSEAGEFLSHVMGLDLSTDNVAALEARTEGWIAGLQLAAISMQGQKDASGFIKSFTGSHRFVLDYLIEEVLERQPESVQTFLLRTSILERMCGPLCDAVLRAPAGAGQETLQTIEDANLFVVPLDNERHWYRYHHLFADLLRQRLYQSVASSTEDEGISLAELHRRASQWYESHGLELEAFRHAVAANDVEGAGRLIRERGMPMHSMPVATAILDWLESLPKAVLDASPWLWVRSATSNLMAGQLTGVEEKLKAAEEAMKDTEPDDKTRDLLGQIAAIRATLALLQAQTDLAVTQAQRALANLRPDNLPFRSRASWALGYSYKLKGDRAAARQAYTEAIRQASGMVYYTVLSSTSLGHLEESETRLHEAAEIYRRSLELLSDQGPPDASEEYMGLARVLYEWNDLEAAEQYAQLGLQQSHQYDPAIDRHIVCEVVLARIRLAQGAVDGAAATLAQARQSAGEGNFTVRLAEIAAAQVPVLLRQGQIEAAAQVAKQYELALSQARVLVAQEDPAAALAILEPYREQMKAKEWADERLKATVLQAVALEAHGETDKAMQVLGDALRLAEPGGFIRLFVDEGAPMARLLSEARSRGVMPDYVGRLLAAFASEARRGQEASEASNELLTQRELEVLQLIAQGLSNQEIGERLFLALDTVKGHNRRIYAKLQVQSRTEAVARARELGLL